MGWGDLSVSDQTAAVIVQHPNFFGTLEDMERIGEEAHAKGALFVACVDPISLGILTPPGEYDADIVVGEGQPLGCPMGYGGPLLGFFACKTKFMRRLPGRIVGQTTDGDGKRAFVMTLRTREQDIRRERATSNICTNEALYALAASVYLATMGKQGLIGSRRAVPAKVPLCRFGNRASARLARWHSPTSRSSRSSPSRRRFIRHHQQQADGAGDDRRPGAERLVPGTW